MAYSELRSEKEVLYTGREVEVRIEYEPEERKVETIVREEMRVEAPTINYDFFASPIESISRNEVTRLSVALPSLCETTLDSKDGYVRCSNFGDAELAIQKGTP